MISSQLDLWPSEVSRLPWGGLAPRDLTRGRTALFLRPEPQKDACDFLDPDQLEFRPTGEKAPWIYQGAPLLLELEGTI